MAEQIGQYNRRIEIWQHTGARDAAGEVLVNDWVLYKQLWSKIVGRNGMSWIREIGATHGTTADAAIDLISFRVRYRTDITNEMQVRGNNIKPMDIILIREDNAGHEFIDIVCRSGASSG